MVGQIRAATILALAALLGGCAGMIDLPKKRTLEQEAINVAVTLCKKFGHQPETKEFIACAESRFDEYINHRR